MPDVIEFYLAGEPAGKEQPRFRRATGRTYTAERTVRFMDRLSIVAQQAMEGLELFNGALRVVVVARVAIPKSRSKRWREAALAGQIRPTKKPDWDNFGKVLDACNQIVWVDDAQIVDGRVLKFYSASPGYHVRVEALREGVFE